jgi:hypothetical protein
MISVGNTVVQQLADDFRSLVFRRIGEELGQRIRFRHKSDQIQVDSSQESCVVHTIRLRHVMNNHVRIKDSVNRVFTSMDRWR